jgi:predicted transposase YbfD/YdcC
MRLSVAKLGQLVVEYGAQGVERTLQDSVHDVQDVALQGATLGKVFIAECARIQDHRQPGKIEYPLHEILFALLVGVLCTANSVYHAMLFAAEKIDFLREFLPYANGVASHDTACRALRYIDRKEFSKFFTGWIERIFGVEKGSAIAIDGKTVRRSMNGDVPPIHLVSAFEHGQGMVLGQMKTEEKSNEITAIPQLIDILDVKNAVFTIDAAGTQTDIVDGIIEKGCNYLLAVKGNQPKLHEACIDTFEIFDAAMTNAGIQIYKSDCEKDHGRIEQRTYEITDNLGLLDEIQCRWKNVKSIVRVTSTVDIDGVNRDSVRYFITSLSPDAVEIANVIRGHWGIENNLHWILDTAFDDDDCRVRCDNAAANFCTIKHFALNMLKEHKPDKKLSVKSKRGLALANTSFLRSILASATSPGSP